MAADMPAPEPVAAEPEKKGRPSWAPAQMLWIHDLDPRFEYRWESKDEAMLQKKLAEGAQLCNSANDRSKRDASGDTIADGKPLTSLDSYRDVVKTRVPKEVAAARRAYLQEQTDQQLLQFKQNAQTRLDELAKGTTHKPQLHGRIVIE